MRVHLPLPDSAQPPSPVDPPSSLPLPDLSPGDRAQGYEYLRLSPFVVRSLGFASCELRNSWGDSLSHHLALRRPTRLGGGRRGWEEEQLLGPWVSPPVALTMASC